MKPRWKDVARPHADRPWPVPARPWAGHMTWRDLAFLHWPLLPERVRPRIPRGLELEVRDGAAWIGIVPFRMENVGVRGLPRIPGVSAFPELNVRTYVTAGGKPGIWFFSLDAASALAVAGARIGFHLPYFRARMETDRADGWVRYRSHRTDRRGAAADFQGRYRPTGPVRPAAPGTLEHFLTARYCLYAADRRGRLFRGDIQHVPWPLQPGEAELTRNTCAGAHGLELPDSRPLVHVAERLDVVAWTLEAVERA